jgi:putative nucleotide binding protein
MRTDKKEINAIILDILPVGHTDPRRPQFRKEPLLQAVGTEQFKLLELVPKSVEIIIHDEVYIGDAERDQIERVKRRISYEELTPTARLELPFAAERIISAQEARFVDFFNKAISVTPKLHMLHLLPGIGKKLMWEILEEREKRPFDSYKDISDRIKAIPHPEQMILKRVLEELMDPDVKYHLFTSK